MLKNHPTLSVGVQHILGSFWAPNMRKAQHLSNNVKHNSVGDIRSRRPGQNLFYKKYFKDVSREFDEFRVNTHLCKLRCWYL